MSFALVDKLKLSSREEISLEHLLIAFYFFLVDKLN